MSDQTTDQPRLVITTNGPGATRETRYRLDMGALRDALAPDSVPAWVRERGRQGGAHTLETCESCNARHWVRKRRQSEWAVMDAATSHAETMFAGRQAKADSVNYPYLPAEHTEAVRRQIARILRIAGRCPERRIPETHKALRRMASELSESSHQHQRMLGIVCSVAADMAWSRYVDAVQGRPMTQRHADSERGSIGRTAITEDDLFHCPECDALGADSMA